MKRTIVLKRPIYFNLILLLILFSVVVLAAYAVGSYKGGNLSGQYPTGQPRFSQGAVAPGLHGLGTGPPKGLAGNTAGPAAAAPPGKGRQSGPTGAGTKYASDIVAYAVAFFALAVFGFWALRKIKIDPDNAKILVLTLLGGGLLVRISLATLVTGQPFDLRLFATWATAAAGNFRHFFSGGSISDYPPLYIYVLFIIGKITTIPSMSPYSILLLKLPSMIADIATSFLIYKLARKYLYLEISIFLTAFYVLNPAIFINSTYWGQVDSFFTLIVISSIYLLSEQRIGPASALFTAAVLMKPQGIIFLPVLFYELCRRRKWSNFIKAALWALGTALAVILPFSTGLNILWIFQLFLRTAGEYRFASVNAFNFFSLLGANYKIDASTLFGFSYYTWGIIFIVLVTLLSGVILMKGNNKAYIPAVSLLQIAGVFTLSTRMHERYLFPAIALAILTFIYLRDKRFLVLAAGFSFTEYVNTHYVLYETGIGVNAVPSGPLLILTSLLNVLLFLYLVWILFDVAIGKKKMRFDTQDHVPAGKQPPVVRRGPKSEFIPSITRRSRPGRRPGPAETPLRHAKGYSFPSDGQAGTV